MIPTKVFFVFRIFMYESLFNEDEWGSKLELKSRKLSSIHIEEDKWGEQVSILN